MIRLQENFLSSIRDWVSSWETGSPRVLALKSYSLEDQSEPSEVTCFPSCMTANTIPCSRSSLRQLSEAFSCFNGQVYPIPSFLRRHSVSSRPGRKLQVETCERFMVLGSKTKGVLALTLEHLG